MCEAAGGHMIPVSILIFRTAFHTRLIWIINRIPYPLQFTPPPPPCAPLYYEPQYKQYESEYNASCDRFYTLGAQVCNSYYGPYYETPNMEEEYGFRTFISRSHELRTAMQAIQERIQNVLCSMVHSWCTGS